MKLWQWLKNRSWHITLFRIFLPTFSKPNEKPVEVAAHQPAPTPKKPMDPKKAFICKLRALAEKIEVDQGIPWQLIVAQAAHESRYGQSDLARDGNNLFGVTAGSWKKKNLPLVTYRTWENSPKPPEYWREPGRGWETVGDVLDVEPNGKGGSKVIVMRAFRKYGSWQESLDDWLYIIRKYHPNAYHAAIMGNSLKFFVELKRSGYATDDDYAMKLDRVRSEIEGIA